MSTISVSLLHAADHFQYSSFNSASSYSNEYAVDFFRKMDPANLEQSVNQILQGYWSGILTSHALKPMSMNLLNSKRPYTSKQIRWMTSLVSEVILSAVHKATDNRGADVVFESAGEETFPGSVTAAASGGRIVSFSTTTGGMPTLNLRELFWKQASVLGTTMGSPRDFDALLAFATAHHLAPVIDRVFPLAEVSAAFARLEAGKQMGGIVLSIG